MITEALIFKAIVTTQEIDFSFWALFARATLTVKIVILMLIGASFWAWAIIIQRHLVFNSATAASRDFLAYSPPAKFGLPGVIRTDSFQVCITFIFRGMAS